MIRHLHTTVQSMVAEHAGADASVQG